MSHFKQPFLQSLGHAAELFAAVAWWGRVVLARASQERPAMRRHACHSFPRTLSSTRISLLTLLLSTNLPAAAGEHTVIMLRPLQSAEVADTAWLAPFVSDFRTRFMALLEGGQYRGRKLHGTMPACTAWQGLAWVLQWGVGT